MERETTADFLLQRRGRDWIDWLPGAVGKIWVSLQPAYCLERSGPWISLNRESVIKKQVGCLEGKRSVESTGGGSRGQGPKKGHQGCSAVEPDEGWGVGSEERERQICRQSTWVSPHRSILMQLP